jgi:hypothetical protein
VWKPVTLLYPLERINFLPWAQSALSIACLEDLHLRQDPNPFLDYVERLTFFTGRLKDAFDGVLESYLLLTEIVASALDGICHVQRPPSFRCHLSGAGTASSFHRDGDPKYRLRSGSINAWVPLTGVSGNNSIFIESEPGAADYRPWSMKPGEILVFDAFHLMHGSRCNDTNTTRVSFDFRFTPRNPERIYELGISEKR